MWKERNIDLWSLNHLLFGCTLAVFMKSFGFDFFTAVGLAVAIFLVWEVIELSNRIFETKINKISDVALELLGFIVFYKIEFSQKVYIVLFLAFGLLEFFGFYSRIKEGQKNLLNYICIFLAVAYSFSGIFILLL
ncbi:MAG: hypothetical protein A2566_03385 [Candidatus Zambryskibacteria bacterium RIFOXYD1_FULL_40_13]|nr:MAG: hypothetical protein UT25_C0002G0011 [Parcubacteria group bacterium GW2011_GWC1_39_12]KKR19490.1 MAG: hypothetical protein UT49_C0002G0336 [Parcubacteria group bacterium GW2011_GWF1_39_37]KKR35116.1 MAG: hypothetical protein UT68_C0005G0065 [Parcubacteria group bacterium GW2011_GWC2_40_10]KKR52439.1 MAG: hypothetical protein UT89_C0002G0240 [Parcubacteria group bacterium GW2011_GWE1_40_20]KKR65897.1 MAG: hypothetical protein UU06_C0009G0014 [Parcubacteria group bacterium GW2011_GWB1_40_